MNRNEVLVDGSTSASSVPLEIPRQIAFQAGRSLRLLTETVSMHRSSEEHSETRNLFL